MRMTEQFVANGLFADMHFVHIKVLVFRLRALSHRMMCFGYEKFVNTYSPRELVMLAALMQNFQHNALIREAYARGDAALKSWLEANCPELCKERAHVG